MVNIIPLKMRMPEGSKMEAITSAESSSISTDYWCNVCTSYWNKFMEHSDEIGFGELRIEDEEGWEEIRKSVEEVCV